jgi:hypothetical protein
MLPILSEITHFIGSKYTAMSNLSDSNPSYMIAKSDYYYCNSADAPLLTNQNDIRKYSRKSVFGGFPLVKVQRKAVNRFRKRLKQQGMARLEVNVRKVDAALVRNVVRALSNPEQEQIARALLREHFGSRPAEGLKALLAAAPLEGINLSRERDFSRDVDL